MTFKFIIDMLGKGNSHPNIFVIDFDDKGSSVVSSSRSFEKSSSGELNAEDIDEFLHVSFSFVYISELFLLLFIIIVYIHSGFYNNTIFKNNGDEIC